MNEENINDNNLTPTHLNNSIMDNEEKTLNLVYQILVKRNRVSKFDAYFLNHMI